MNTLAHLACLVALFWLAVFVFDDLGQPALGYAVIGAFLMFIPLTFLAVLQDWELLRGREK